MKCARWVFPIVVLLTGCLTDYNADGTFMVGCLGDSNTAKGWPTASVISWCEMGQAAQPTAIVWKRSKLLTEPTAVINEATMMATACPPPYRWSWGGTQLLDAKKKGADILIAAFGTNDVNVLGKTPSQIVGCYQALAWLAYPLPLYIALTPPNFQTTAPGAYDPSIVQRVNDALRAAFPAKQLIDFTIADFDPDGIHLSLAEGQPKRAAIALTFLEQK
jgi:hypothetical protein